MFLINTADRRFWRTDGRVLFLGEWCKLYSERAWWQPLAADVVPYHWDDREKLYRDYLYTCELYERYLAQLAERLNQLHGVNHSPRYWRIVIGPWLYLFIAILFDSYESIVAAERTGQATLTSIGEYDPAQLVLRDNWDFIACTGRDAYRQYLYSQVLEWRRQMPFEKIGVRFDVKDFTTTRVVRTKSSSVGKETLIKGLQALSRWIPDRLNRIVLVYPALSPLDQTRLQLALGQGPYLFDPMVETPAAAVDWNLRARIAVSSGDADFECFLASMLPKQLPSVYLEGYREMNQRAAQHYPRGPRVIFNAVSFETNEAFKFWAADQVDRGCPLVGTQHGNCGASLWFHEVDHQIRIYDRFYTWGWRPDRYENTRPLAAAKFNKGRKSLKPKADGRILLVQHVWPRYAYKMYAVPVSATGVLAYLEDQFEFVGGLSPSVRKLVLVRPFLNDRDWSQRERWKEKHPDVECQAAGGMQTSMNRSRLLVTCVIGTPAVEGLAADFPTILTWNPRQFEVRPAAQPYFDDLMRAGVLHATPHSAAEKVNEIADDPLSWWRMPEVQAATGRFCEQFARVSDNWLHEWKAELKQLARAPRRGRPSDLAVVPTP